MTTTPPRTTYEVTPRDLHRVLIALALSALIVWLAWAVPIADWVLATANGASAEIGRVAAAQDVVTQGWWAVIVIVIVITFAMTVGSLTAVAMDYSHGRNWSLTALKKATGLAAVTISMWAIWTVSVLAAAGVPTIG
ncbi:hypothetical protein CH260_03590 [Rhodococcus sp. 05-2256-B2]|uniref:hypothetical protein n=1 Tax=unclassified Rhodococcus (in: high G+C Gram-positive bacteria) TaxID=192944 RepID=UPI000B9AAA51|nr:MULTISPECIES: hypothetical protein [unclassified Rhodococcus (in: high G+C Gram-positive bacteria)]MBY4382101.1 hypothetical protein [Rhodococcus fascians]MBY4396970.1 hypothetical protein [Rhodococcus fascians]MBY4405790.1 hypothetical protein [Rhodococcus fascians]MBY4421728.1 hypothetical protein [Rhodococcus fascians]MBY4461002.1 hypothetical protein [Rhodococcus fascians]